MKSRNDASKLSRSRQDLQLWIKFLEAGWNRHQLQSYLASFALVKLNWLILFALLLSFLLNCVGVKEKSYISTLKAIFGLSELKLYHKDSEWVSSCPSRYNTSSRVFADADETLENIIICRVFSHEEQIGKIWQAYLRHAMSHASS